MTIHKIEQKDDVTVPEVGTCVWVLNWVTVTFIHCLQHKRNQLCNLEQIEA